VNEKKSSPNQNRIKQLRLEQHKTQKEVGKAVGLSDRAIAHYEKGIREPKLETWFKLSDFFDVPVSYLQGISNSRDYGENMSSFKRDLYKSVSDNLKKQLKTNDEQLTYIFSSIVIERFVNIFDAAIKNVDLGTYLKDRYVSLAKKLDDFNKINNINAMVTRGLMLSLEAEQDPIAAKKIDEIMKIIFSYHFSDKPDKSTSKRD
jgi:transcriptional regulator with XRE-family HTH domain